MLGGGGGDLVMVMLVAAVVDSGCQKIKKCTITSIKFTRSYQGTSSHPTILIPTWVEKVGVAYQYVG